jgi:hypothetical protein
MGRGLKKEFDSLGQIWYIENTKGSLRSDLPLKTINLYLNSRQLLGVVGGYFLPLNQSALQSYSFGVLLLLQFKYPDLKRLYVDLCT